MYSVTTEETSCGAKACKSSSASIGIRTGSSGTRIGLSDTCGAGFAGRLAIFGRDHGRDATTDREVADHLHPVRLQPRDQIVQDLVGGGLVEDSAIAELNQVILERLELDTLGVGDVRDTDDPEIGEARFRTQGREFGAVDRNLVVAVGPGVWKRFERRA